MPCFVSLGFWFPVTPPINSTLSLVVWRAEFKAHWFCKLIWWTESHILYWHCFVSIRFACSLICSLWKAKMDFISHDFRNSLCGRFVFPLFMCSCFCSWTEAVSLYYLAQHIVIKQRIYSYVSTRGGYPIMGGQMAMIGGNKLTSLGGLNVVSKKMLSIYPV